VTILKQLGRSLDVQNQSRSVLFQFVLTEFIATYNGIKNSERLYRKIESTLITDNPPHNVKDLLQQLFFSLSKLTGTNIDDELMVPWSTDKGSLNKLRHYCHMLASKSSEDNTEETNFNICVSKSFHSALQAREIILSLDQPLHNKKQSIPNYQALYKFLDKLIDNTHQASRILLQLINSFHDDENVMLFLIQHKDDFERIFKENIIVKLFDKMYTNGIEDAKKLIIEQYKQRGFHDIIEKISNNIDALKS